MQDLALLIHRFSILNERSKTFVIEQAIIKYLNSYTQSNQSVESLDLITQLQDLDNTLDVKIARLMSYLQKDENHQKRLFNCIAEAIETTWYENFCLYYSQNDEFNSIYCKKSLNLISDQGKQMIIVNIHRSLIIEIVGTTLISRDINRNLASFNLYHTLRQNNLTIAEKWNELINYCYNGLNRDQEFYKLCIHEIKIHLIEKAFFIYLNGYYYNNELLNHINKESIIRVIITLSNASLKDLDSRDDELMSMLNDVNIAIDVKWRSIIVALTSYSISQSLYRVIANAIKYVFNDIDIALNNKAQTHFKNGLSWLPENGLFWPPGDNEKDLATLLNSLPSDISSCRNALEITQQMISMDNDLQWKICAVIANYYAATHEDILAIDFYHHAIRILCNVSNKTIDHVLPIIMLKKAECYLKLNRFEEAFKCHYISELMMKINKTNNTTIIDAQYHLLHSKLLMQLMRSEQYLNCIKSFHLADQKSYHTLFYLEYLSAGHTYSGRPDPMILNQARTTEFNYQPFVIDTLIPTPLIMISGSPGIFFSIGQGFFRAISRRPLDQITQLDMIKNLQEISIKTDENEKELIINHIIDNYRHEKKLANSKNSSQLFEKLCKFDLSIKEKWTAILNYMLDKYEFNLTQSCKTIMFKNNGKKLYGIINQVTSSFIANSMLLRQMPHA